MRNPVCWAMRIMLPSSNQNSGWCSRLASEWVDGVGEGCRGESSVSGESLARFRGRVVVSMSPISVDMVVEWSWSRIELQLS